MNESRRNALVAALAWRLRHRGNWSGETHIQKATYLLQHLAGTPLGFRFILYKHGPFSFELRDALSSMRADGVLDPELQPYPYGPSLVVPDNQRTRVEANYPNALKKYAGELDDVADWVSNKNVSTLEQLATALYVTLEGDGGASVSERATQITALKPHVSEPEATWAINELDKKRSQFQHPEV